MPDPGPSPLVELQINGSPVQVPAGATVAAALLRAGAPCRISRTGLPRAAFCGMGICYECRATINGIPHQRACLIACAPGMEVRTG